MSGDRVILAVKYTPAGSPGQVRKAVGGFLRYVQYRDKHPDSAPPAAAGVSGLLKYVSYRDRSGSCARLFDAAGPAGDLQRRQLGEHVARALAATRPQLERTAGGKAVDRRRAVYRFVHSPERAEGLDLRQLTRGVMAQLASDVGAGELRWIAAEHRNTAHPHVHIVLSGFRETDQGQYRAFVVTRARLARMKEALSHEIERQRSLTAPAIGGEASAASNPTAHPKTMVFPTGHHRRRSAAASLPAAARRRRSAGGRPRGLLRVAILRRLGRRYRREAERTRQAELHERARQGRGSR